MSDNADLAELRAIAESGQRAPQLGGRFFMWWGGLAGLALLAHWATLVGLSPLPLPMIGLIWAVYGLVGVTGSAILSASLRGKPGRGAALNRAESAFWTAATIGFIAYVAGIVALVLLRGGSVILFDTIPPLAFLVYGLAFRINNALGGPGFFGPLSYLSFAFCTGALILVGTPELYLFSAASQLVISIGPGLILMGREPAADA